MGIITKFFTKGNETKLGKLNNEVAELNSKVSGLSGKIGQVDKALELAKVDLMLDENATNKKAVAKYETAKEKFSTEIANHQTKLSELAQQIQAITDEELQAELKEAAEKDTENNALTIKSRKVESMIRAKADHIDNFMLSGGSQANLRRLAVSRGHMSKHVNHISGIYSDALKEAQDKMDIQIDKEYSEFMKAWNKYFGESN
ncbi:hypothetical protein ACQ3VH_10195 [Bacillus pretiosus]|uniref:hypothetical protein n=1 Tax=Bacillus TaxID=1386 RepID=UPI0018F2A800|nr:hypothetical protein [Bacillus cereus group sp. N6]MBJ8113455.1 hypothetical protein [Bacillus cereus group sp. N6]